MLRIKESSERDIGGGRREIGGGVDGSGGRVIH